MLALVPVATTAANKTPVAGRDRTPPTAPGDLRVTAVTSFSVSLAWSPSTDNSGSFTYRIRHSWGYEAAVPQTQTSFTWTDNLESRQTYSFFVYAVDAAGNQSTASNTVTVTLPRDTSPPTKPVVSVIGVGTTQVSLAWAAQDDGPFVFYWVFQDGSPVIEGSSSTSATIPLLAPETTYTFTVQARDNGINWSPLSDPVTVTTAPANPDDTTPPTTPANLMDWGGSTVGCEVWLIWDASTDNVDPPEAIIYEVYVNGILDHRLSLGRTSTVLYGTVDGPNTIQVIAVDSAGNASAPATITFNLSGC